MRGETGGRDGGWGTGLVGHDGGVFGVLRQGQQDVARLMLEESSSGCPIANRLEEDKVDAGGLERGPQRACRRGGSSFRHDMYNHGMGWHCQSHKERAGMGALSFSLSSIPQIFSSALLAHSLGDLVVLQAGPLLTGGSLSPGPHRRQDVQEEADERVGILGPQLSDAYISQRLDRGRGARR